MSKPWSAEVELSSSAALSLINEQFPQLGATDIRLLGVGWDNWAYLVDEHFVFRFPRRQLGADCLEPETRVLPRLHSRLPIPVPNPQYVGHPTERFPWLFAGYRCLNGRTACSAGMADGARMATIPAMATFLAQLHSISAEEGFAMGAPGDRLGRLDPVKRIPKMHERIESLAGLNLIAEPKQYHSLVDQLGTARPPRVDSLLHGDFYVRHLLVDAEERLCGIIDWGDMHVGDIALDLSIAFTFLPPQGRATFREAYGTIDDATWKLARYRGISYGLILSEYGHAEQDLDLLREGQWILNSVVVE